MNVTDSSGNATAFGLLSQQRWRTGAGAIQLSIGEHSRLGWSGRLMWLGPKAYAWAGPTDTAVSYMYGPRQQSY